MASPASSPESILALPRRRRTGGSVWIAVAIVAAWYGGKAAVRWHVDELIAGKVDQPLQAFALRDRNGGEWTQERLRGRPAVLHFFRSHCEACDAEAAEYREFERQVSDRATILHVCTDAVLEFEPALTARTIANKQFAAPVLIADRAFVDAFHTVKWSNVTPVTYVVDGKGTIRRALRGAQTTATLAAALATAQ